MKIDPRIEIFVDSLQHQANESNTDITVEGAFNDARGEQSVMVHNLDNNGIGIIATEVTEYKETEQVIFLIFNGKLYDYCKAEGFSRDGMLNGFQDQIMKKVDREEFFDFILGKSNK
tara:strand:+ start:513 stop:863 length:351 start_codon:yes stop_codon:yes gene_type:complete